MKNKDQELIQIRNDIIKDIDNQEYTNMGWLPIYTISSKSKIIIIGQAPGIKAQTSEIAWNDLSGNKLRSWLGVSKEQFYNTDIFGLVPMDFYFPGSSKSGDLPPRRNFASKWHPKLFSNLDDLKLIILIGNYSQKYYLKDSAKTNLTAKVKSYTEYLPTYFPLPHPSPRNIGWHINNPWFEEEVIPELKRVVQEIITGKGE